MDIFPNYCHYRGQMLVIHTIIDYAIIQDIAKEYSLSQLQLLLAGLPRNLI